MDVKLDFDLNIMNVIYWTLEEVDTYIFFKLTHLCIQQLLWCIFITREIRNFLNVEHYWLFPAFTYTHTKHKHQFRVKPELREKVGNQRTETTQIVLHVVALFASFQWYHGSKIIVVYVQYMPCIKIIHLSMWQVGKIRWSPTLLTSLNHMSLQWTEY